MTVYLISDTHFGHENIIRYCNRPFPSAAVMDECMMDAWNDTVRKPNDIVWHLGDVYFRRSMPLWKLAGRKRLLLGNHDSAKDPVLTEAFEVIKMCHKVAGMSALMTHMPIIIDEFERKVPDGFTINLHGHIHNNCPSPTPDHINMSCEEWDYRPVDLDRVYEECIKPRIEGRDSGDQSSTINWRPQIGNHALTEVEIVERKWLDPSWVRSIMGGASP